MTVNDIIDGIIQKQNAIGMTNQQLADASGVPKSTIDRIRRHDTPNPTMQTILDLAAAVGYTFTNQPEPTPPIPETVTINDPMLKILLAHYEQQSLAHSEHLKRTASHYNMLLAEKNRTIRTLSVIIGLLISGFFSILLIDLATPELGWFPHDANSITIGLAIVGIITLISGAFILRKKAKE